MSATATINRTTTKRVTYLGRRAVVMTEYHDSSPIGLRTITTEWIDDATAENGGHKAGTVTRAVVKGDGRYASGAKAWTVVEPLRVVSEVCQGLCGA